MLRLADNKLVRPSPCSSVSGRLADGSRLDAFFGHTSALAGWLGHPDGPSGTVWQYPRVNE